MSVSQLFVQHMSYVLSYDEGLYELCMIVKRMLESFLRIDTGSWSVNCSTLCDEMPTECSLTNYYT